MSSKDDLELAKALQAEYDIESAQELDSNDGVFDPSKFQSPPNRQLQVAGNENMSIVDQRWELLDPSPDVRALFLEFNDRYFWGRLAGVEVRWSPRMTLCAGLCCYEGRGGLCSVRLSTPLLKLRPRKDLVETLLHEMIHAYLFITDNNKDHDGHGPEFCKHMKRLNTETGTNISIYHTFHDEVANYRQHWWKCSGPCVKKPPYFGIVKRAMNRAPSKQDTWWADHQRTCGGTYTKIKEPEGYGEKKKGSKRKKEDGADGSENEKGAKRQATIKTNGEPFPGKGTQLGIGTSSKPTLLQLWIAEQKSKQKDSSSTSVPKTKPPAALGAPPSSSQSSQSGTKDTTKQTKTDPTPLQKWITKNTDSIKKVVSKSPPSSSKPGTSQVNGDVNKGRKRTDPFANPHVVKINGRNAPDKSKHQRKRSGKRQQLMAIFDSDSDSDDELFRKPSRRKPNATGVNVPVSKSVSPASRSNNQVPTYSNSTPKHQPGISPGVPARIKTEGSFGASKTTNSGYPHLPPTRPNVNNRFETPPSSSRHGSPLSQSSTSSTPDSYARPKPVFTGSKITSPSNQHTPGSSSGVSGGRQHIYGVNTNFPPYAGGSNTGASVHNVPGVGTVNPPSKTVPCPVCTMSVPELDINAHLDMCLS